MGDEINYQHTLNYNDREQGIGIQGGPGNGPPASDSRNTASNEYLGLGRIPASSGAYDFHGTGFDEGLGGDASMAGGMNSGAAPWEPSPSHGPAASTGSIFPAAQQLPHNMQNFQQFQQFQQITGTSMFNSIPTGGSGFGYGAPGSGMDTGMSAPGGRQGQGEFGGMSSLIGSSASTSRGSSSLSTSPHSQSQSLPLQDPRSLFDPLMVSGAAGGHHPLLAPGPSTSAGGGVQHMYQSMYQSQHQQRQGSGQKMLPGFEDVGTLCQSSGYQQQGRAGLGPGSQQGPQQGSNSNSGSRGSTSPVPPFGPSHSSNYQQQSMSYRQQQQHGPRGGLGGGGYRSSMGGGDSRDRGDRDRDGWNRDRERERGRERDRGDRERDRGGYSTFAGTGGSNAQGRAINKMLLEILRERVVDPQRLDLAVETYVERMDCVNLATLLFHTGKKRLLLAPGFIRRIAQRFTGVREELRAREASNALYGLKCMSSELPEVRELAVALASKVGSSSSEFVAQAVGNALYGLQMMTSEHEEVRTLLQVLAGKVGQCTELLEAQNVGNALYGLRGMSSDQREVRAVVAALTPKIATAREDLNGQALGNSLYGLQSMCSKEAEVRFLLSVLATKVTRTWEDLKAQEVGNALYGLKRMSTDVPEVRILISALVPKVAASPEILDAQAIGNSFYGLQNMCSDNAELLSLLAVMAEKVALACPELDGQAMGNSLYGLQGMSSKFPEVRAVVAALTTKMQASCLDMNAQELGNAMYGLQHMTSEHVEVQRLLAALTQKAMSSKHELTSQEIGNAMFGLQGMCSQCPEVRLLVRQMAIKIQQSHSVLDPQAVSNCLFGLQRMSSDSEDVRLLVQALANKIEHFWKLLGAQHLANALFGLQALSSAEAEVRYLARALAPKLLSCRDELSATQLAHALFGLQGMSSEHAEVRSLVAVLADKAAQSRDDGWTLSLLALALTGLQGMSCSCEEVRSLVSCLAAKASCIPLTDLSPTPSPTPASSPTTSTSAAAHDGSSAGIAHDLANCLFGLQRMGKGVGQSQPPVEVLRLLGVLADHLGALPAATRALDARTCASALFGLTSCRFANSEVRRVLWLLAPHVERLAAQLDPPAEETADQQEPPSTQKEDHQQQQQQANRAASGIQDEDALCLYQSLTLCLHSLRLLDADSLSPSANSDHQTTPVHPSNESSISSNGDPAPATGEDGSMDGAALAQRLLASHSSLLQALERLRDAPPAPDGPPRMQRLPLGARALSVAEQRMAEELTELLQPPSPATNPLGAPAPAVNTSSASLFTVRTNAWFHGFHATAVVQFNPSLSVVLETRSGVTWAPVLNVELLGSSSAMPAKQHFCALRRAFLQEVHGAAVTTVPAASFRVDGQQGIRIHASTALAPLFPDNRDDAAAIESMLSGLPGFAPWSSLPAILSSAMVPSAPGRMKHTPSAQSQTQTQTPLGTTDLRDCGGLFGLEDGGMSLNLHGNDGGGVNGDGGPQHTQQSKLLPLPGRAFRGLSGSGSGSEYYDDDLGQHTCGSSSNGGERKAPSLFGMLLPRWLGEWPTISHPNAPALFASHLQQQHARENVPHIVLGTPPSSGTSSENGHAPGGDAGVGNVSPIGSQRSSHSSSPVPAPPLHGSKASQGALSHLPPTAPGHAGHNSSQQHSQQRHAAKCIGNGNGNETDGNITDSSAGSARARGARMQEHPSSDSTSRNIGPGHHYNAAGIADDQLGLGETASASAAPWAGPSGDSELDDEIAALEAQLEVARLEARIKLLKSKKLAAAHAQQAKTEAGQSQ